MSTSPASIPGLSNSTSGAQERPGYRTKTIATRITPEELAEIETAAEQSSPKKPAQAALPLAHAPAVKRDGFRWYASQEIE